MDLDGKSEERQPQDKPYIKLYKNETSKGKIYYNWEIKLYECSIEEIKAKNEEMKLNFSSEGLTDEY